MKCEFFSGVSEIIQNLQFEEKPNYGLLRHLLAKNLMEKNMVPNN